MKANRSSVTAQGIALLRALESDRPATERICYDPLARRMISPVFYQIGRLMTPFMERRSPGVVGFIAARTRYIDDYLSASIAGGIAQLVILGAGLDSRAYRFPDLPGHVRVFEVDHPATQAGKIAAVKRIFGQVPDHVTFVPIDFNVGTLAELTRAGYDTAVQSLFIWEGVTPYLSAGAVDGTLDFIAHCSGPRTAVIFDYMYAESLTGSRRRGEVVRMARARRFTGEGLVFGIPRGQAQAFLEARGYTEVVDAEAVDFNRLYCSGANRDRAVADIYAIAHACVAQRI